MDQKQFRSAIHLWRLEHHMCQGLGRLEEPHHEPVGEVTELQEGLTRETCLRPSPDVVRLMRALPSHKRTMLTMPEGRRRSSPRPIIPGWQMS